MEVKNMSKEVIPFDRIERTCMELNKYNETHGTNYSYGEYKALVRQKKIRPVLLDDKKQKK